MNFKKLEAVCKENGITEVELHQIKESGTSVSTFNKEVDENVSYSKNELFIRGVYNNHITSIYVENDSDDEIPFIVSSLVSNASSTESKDPYFIYEGSKEYPTINPRANDYAKYSQGDFIKMCKDTEDFLKSKSELITNTSVSIEVATEEVNIINSNGLNVSRKSEYGVIYASVVIFKDGQSKNGSYFDFVDKFSDIDYDKMYQRAVKRTIDSLGAKSIPSSQYPVVFEAPMASSLISCFLSMFSGEAVVKKISLLADKLGKKVFGDNISFVDDPFCKDSFRQYTFDDEGVSAKETSVVENGVLKTYLHSLSTAKMLNTSSTGNGFKNDSGVVSVAPTNLCIKCGDKSFEEMISPIKEGVFITQLMGQHAGVNAVTGAFNLQASGFMIENGKITRPLTLIIVSGNIIDLLNNVVDISSDFEVKGRVGTGSIYVNSLAVSGQ